MTGTRSIFIQRNSEIAKQYKSGMTLDEVGSANGMTRERVRQIVSKFGIDKTEGGSAIQSFKNIGHKVAAIKAILDAAESRCFRRWAMSTDQYIAHVAEFGNTSRKSSPMCKYMSQRNSANRRGIKWNFTFSDWWGIWLASGKWDLRGLGAGLYVMARYGDGDTQYSVDTVYICTQSQNSKDSFIVSPAAIRFAESSCAGKGKGWSYVPGKSRKNPYVVHFRGKHIGQFPTKEKARAAYLKLWAAV